MFHYFGYGSNMNMTSLRAKGVDPQSSEKAVLRGWKLLFNVEHWFRHEGGVGNICRTDDPSDIVRGVVHLCRDADLASLDAMEAYGVGYERVEVELETKDGKQDATAYIGCPRHTRDDCLPTRRYLNILIDGAEAVGLPADYVQRLRDQPVHVTGPYPSFRHPEGEFPNFDAETLASHPKYTAVAGAVFDMADARWQHHYLWGLFGGKDMTLFHLRRLDTSDGTETLEDVRREEYSPSQREYLNAYLNEYDAEYVYVGRFRY